MREHEHLLLCDAEYTYIREHEWRKRHFITHRNESGTGRMMNVRACARWPIDRKARDTNQCGAYTHACLEMNGGMAKALTPQPLCAGASENRIYGSGNGRCECGLCDCNV